MSNSTVHPVSSTRDLLVAARMTLFTLALTGILYPLVVTACAHLLFSHAAEGSFVTDDHNRVVGSELIGQATENAAYLHPRPSAAGESGYDATASSGSNLGTTSKKLRERAVETLARLTRENPNAETPVPDELLTASGSGLDPHLSPTGALWQVPRIARARGVDAGRVRAVVESHVEGRDWGFLGEPRVNVLLVNLALDRSFGSQHATPPQRSAAVP